MTILQILAVLVRDSVPEAGVQNITDRYLNALKTEHIEAVWDSGSKAIRKAFGFFDNQLRLPGPALIPNRYFYMTAAAYLYENRNPDYEFLKKYFWYYSFHNDDLLTNTSHLRDHVVRLRSTRDGADFGFGRFVIDKGSCGGSGTAAVGVSRVPSLRSTPTKIPWTGRCRTDRCSLRSTVS